MTSLICSDSSSSSSLITLFASAGPGRLVHALLPDFFAKLLAALFLFTIWKISRGGIGFGDILSLLSLSLCCAFSTWIFAVIIGFALAFFFAMLLFFRNIFRHSNHSARSFNFPFIPFLLFGFLLSFFAV